MSSTKKKLVAKTSKRKAFSISDNTYDDGNIIG
jgi:hypothetical protein